MRPRPVSPGNALDLNGFGLANGFPALIQFSQGPDQPSSNYYERIGNRFVGVKCVPALDLALKIASLVAPLTAVLIL